VTTAKPPSGAGIDVHVRRLSVRFGAWPAVDDVDLSVRAGELFMLLGPSGCGKTTLLRTLAGFQSADSGSILFGEEDVTHRPPHARGAAMVFQSFALWPHLSAAENVAFGLRERNVPRRDVGARVDAALASVRLEGLGSRAIDELSGGEQQRVALARAMVVRPRCLLLDEPLSSLDAALRQSMREEVRRICKRSELTAIYVTHDQKEALAIADRIAVMRHGRILQVGSPGDVYRRPSSREVATFLGATNLLAAKVVRIEAGEAIVETAIGSCRAAVAGSFRPDAGAQVWLSIRPECLRFSAGVSHPSTDASHPNRFEGRRERSLFLGELSEHWVRVRDELLCAYELSRGRRGADPDSATLEVDPEDVVLLPAGEEAERK
jgi:iron(III) transport system ATP-binding protein